MFEHLDDPDGFTPDGTFRRAVVHRGRSRRRRAWLARGTAVSVVAVLAAGAGAVAMVDQRLDDVDRVEVGSLTTDPPADADPYTVLFVGSDRSTGLEGDDPILDGREGVDPASTRSDTAILVRVDPADDRLTVLPLPRDLLVEVPGRGSERLNAARAIGGPQLLIEVIRVDLGIEVNRYVELDLAGAMALGDAVGGLRLAFPAPVRDGRTGLALEAGCQSLDGRALLALARSRHLQHLEAGSWRSDPTSDLGRIERQQAIAGAALASLNHLDTTDPGQLGDLLDVAVRHVTIDSGTTNAELVAMVRDLAGSTVRQLRLPVADAVGPGGARVLERLPTSEPVLAELRPGGAGSGSSPPTTAADPEGPDGAAGPYVPTPC